MLAAQADREKIATITPTLRWAKVDIPGEIVGKLGWIAVQVRRGDIERDESSD